MTRPYQIGDLVHIPQSVELLDCDLYQEADPQLTIPMRVLNTAGPTIGVITEVTSGPYVRIFCDGSHWSVKNSSIYKLGKDSI